MAKPTAKRLGLDARVAERRLSRLVMVPAVGVVLVLGQRLALGGAAGCWEGGGLIE